MFIRPSRVSIFASVLLATGCGGSNQTTVPITTTTKQLDSVARVNQTSAPAVVGTLYLAVGPTSVVAIPLSSNGSTAPQRTIETDARKDTILTGIAVNDDGTLDVISDDPPYQTPDATKCKIQVFRADARGYALAITIPCTSGHAEAGEIARNHYGGFDVTYVDAPTGNGILKRFSSDGASVVNTIPALEFNALSALATDITGNDYVTFSNGEPTGNKIYAYSPSTINGYRPSATSSPIYSSGYGLGSIAVAPDHTVYVVNDSFGATGASVDVLAPGQISVTRSFGPISQGVTALATDSAGELYVALGSFADNAPPATIGVFTFNAGGQPTLVRTITLTPPTTTYILGMAIYQGPTDSGTQPGFSKR